MRFRVGSKLIDIADYESITDEVDSAFRKLFTSFYSENWNLSKLFDEFLPEFERVGIEYLMEHSDPESTRKYFKNLRVIWGDYFQRGRLDDAAAYLSRVVSKIVLEEPRRGFRVHKGPIYYFWGGTALMKGDLDQGFLLMHAAYDEEIRIMEPQPTPAFKFVSLDFADRRQFFGSLVFMYRDYLQAFFNPYRLSKPSTFSVDDFQRNFLQNGRNHDIVFSFTHTLARLHQLDSISRYILYSDFAGQYELSLLFALVLVIENSLRIKHRNFGQDNLLFPALAEDLSFSQSWHLRRGHLTGFINPQVQHHGFDQCIIDLLDRRFCFSHEISNLDLESDLAISYLIRNRGAHDIASSRAVAFRFSDILQSLMNSLFLVVESKYM